MFNGWDAEGWCHERPSGQNPRVRVPYEQASRRTQLQVLRRLARQALAAWELPEPTLRLINHGYNATFGVRAGDARYALRINVQAHKEPGHLAAELAWLDALGSDPELTVPSPQRTCTGELSTMVPSSEFGRPLPAVLFSWLPGHDLGETPTRAQCLAAGRLTARLHGHAEGWTMPPGADLPGIDSVLMNVPDRLAGEVPGLDPESHSVIRAAMGQIQERYDQVVARGPRIALHADLHGWNLRWNAGRLAVLDFDDAGWGVPTQDLAISAYYLRDDARREQWWLEGYAQERSLPVFSTDEYEAVVASRNLVLANDLVTTAHATYRGWLPRYLSNTVARMRNYLETGRYLANAPGVVPLDGG